MDTQRGTAPLQLTQCTLQLLTASDLSFVLYGTPMRKKCCHNPWTLRPCGTNDLTETERRTKTAYDAETICSPRGDEPWTTTHRGRLPPDSASLQRRASNSRVASSLGRFRFWVWKDETKNAENLWKTQKQTRLHRSLRADEPRHFHERAWKDNMFWMQPFFQPLTDRHDMRPQGHRRKCAHLNKAVTTIVCG